MPSVPRYPASYKSYFREGVREKGQTVTITTGTIGAGIATPGVVATIRYPETAVMPGQSLVAAGAKRLHIYRVLVSATVVTDFTAATTVGRSLNLVRASGPAGTADPSGGVAWVPARHRSDLTASDEALAVCHGANTGAMTTTGFVFETPKFRKLNMSGGGVAGKIYEANWEFDDSIFLLPGQILGVRTQAFDAGGTWQLEVEADMVELP